MINSTVRETTVQAFKRVSLKCASHAAILTFVLTVVVVISLVLDAQVRNGTLTYEDVSFPWSYSPSAPPMNRDYDNYTILYGK